MLDKKRHTLRAEGVEYPVCCTFNVLEYLQDKYKDLLVFERLVSGIVEETDEAGEKHTKATPVHVATMLDGLTAMVNEGIAMEREAGADREEVEKARMGRLLRAAGMSLTEAALLVLEELTDCIEPKNAQTAQSPGRRSRKKSKWTLRGFCTCAWRFFTSRSGRPDT